MPHPGGRPLKYTTVKELQDDIDKYFKETPRKEWTITGLALYIGSNRKQLIEYNERNKFRNTIKNAKGKIEAEYEGRAWGGAPTAFAIFALKNFGWTDKSESEIYGRDGKDLIPQPIINVQPDNSNKQNNPTQEED